MATLALLLSENAQTEEQVRLARILDFFGITWNQVCTLGEADAAGEYVVFGTAEMVAAALLKDAIGSDPAKHLPVAFYVYATEDIAASQCGLRALCGNPGIRLQRGPSGDISLRVSSELRDIAGVMAGIEVSTQLKPGDAVLGGIGDNSALATLISAGETRVFVRFEFKGVPVFFCASSRMVDLDDTLQAGFYDIKESFCSAVPLVMFLRHMFQEVAWGPQELGACLIVDDPLLRKKYGSCDFGKLRDVMRRHDFTTNIAFIPWNWRRTAPRAGDFFRNESERFSVSIHGCDHIGAEFGATSARLLNSRAKLAQSRMQNHEARTGIHHDSVMVFPQGVFSSACPEILKHNGFLAAVNTEIVPADSVNSRTRIRDVWDTAIMAYGDFPIFTRRYAGHGLENFAFDLLLGKPCLIVSHHDFFKNDCAELIELIENLQALNCSLTWHPLGEVIRRACRRRRRTGEYVHQFEMYGSELLIENSSDRTIKVHIRKQEKSPDRIVEVQCDQQSTNWTAQVDHIAFDANVGPGRDKHFRVLYHKLDETEQMNRSLQFEFSVAARRFLSEFRDDYISRSSFLSKASANLKNALCRVN